MELKQLQTIQFILQEGSFQKAAERLGYVQSTVTLHIQQLENELKIKLFQKSGRKMVLSKEGEFFWEAAKPLLDHAELVAERIAVFSSGQIGHIRIGAVETIGKEALTPILIDFYKRHPGMKLTLELGGAESIHQRIGDKLLDIGISTAPQGYDSLLFEPICAERMELLLPKEHPLACKEIISLNDLQGIQIMLSAPVCAYSGSANLKLYQLLA